MLGGCAISVGDTTMLTNVVDVLEIILSIEFMLSTSLCICWVIVSIVSLAPKLYVSVFPFDNKTITTKDVPCKDIDCIVAVIILPPSS